MEEYKKTIVYLLKEIQKSESPKDACFLSQSVANLLAVSLTGKDFLMEVFKNEDFKNENSL